MKTTNTQREESRSDLQQRARIIIQKLSTEYPDATIALRYSNPLELLISTILSAQCTDARVNIVTEDLFEHYKTAADYATADLVQLEKEIHSTGFYHAKAKNIIACCKALVEKYNGKVPSTMETLTALAGVGRKTANVVLSGAFGIVEGVVVDTHVARLSQRLGFTSQTNPQKIELDIMNIIPKKDWYVIGNLLVWHGRTICDARKPKCSHCSISLLCPSVQTPHD